MASNSSDQMMRFNVGGKIFETIATTLAVAGPDSFFGPFLNGNWNVQPKNQQDAIFIDRNPECFSVILDLLRTGELHVPPNVRKDLLLKEAQFYGVLDRVRAESWGPFDGNRLSLSTSVTIPVAIGAARMIRASPTGGCCVAHGNTIRVYDWTLREQPPIILNKRVQDIAWIDSKNIIVTGPAPRCIGLFNLFTGEQTLDKFRLTKDVKSPSSLCTLCVDNIDHKIYSGINSSDDSCKKRIVVWDPHRNNPIDFFNKSDLSFSNRSDSAKVDKLQLLPETKSLLVGCYDPSVYDRRNYYLTLLDLRQRKSVWKAGKSIQCEDMVVMESTNTIFVVGNNQRLGSIDLRSNPDDFLQWYAPPGSWIGNSEQEVKLIEHEGQLFSSKGDHILVYSSGDQGCLTLTSRLRTNSNTSSINEIPQITDLSIGNDRLFSLRSRRCEEEPIYDVWFDVWETSPCSPILL